jgi:hypothetical protein
MDIVYRVGGDGYDCVLFAERSTAERVAQTFAALRESTTWGQFRANLPDGEWEDNLQYCFDEDAPADDAPFHRDMVPGYADGDYPEWLRGSAAEWFPRSLIEKYGGSVETSVLNGDALDLPAGKAEAIAADLRAMGHRVTRTDHEIR